jgi:acyl-CoA thioesterase-2
MTRALSDLIETLTLERLNDLTFRGKGSEKDGAVTSFGGHFLGQATRAALETVDGDRNIHSLHGYFLRGGTPGESIDYHVEKIRDGRSFTTRRVIAMQFDRTVFELTASLCVAEEGPSIDPDRPKDFGELPAPESLPRYSELMASNEVVPFPAEWALREHGVDVRTVNAPWSPRGPSEDGGIRLWIRADGNMPDDPKLHSAMLAYQSDESISDNVMVPFGVTWGTPEIMSASLDHAMWFHRRFRMDEWLFVEQRPCTAANARGLATARVWTAEGVHVATYTQEMLLRI